MFDIFTYFGKKMAFYSVDYNYGNRIGVDYHLEVRNKSTECFIQHRKGSAEVAVGVTNSSGRSLICLQTCYTQFFLQYFTRLNYIVLIMKYMSFSE